MPEPTQKERQRARYEDRKKSGICMYCSYPAEKGHIRCEIHREIVADYNAGRRDIRKLKGLCASCGKHAPEAGKVTCTDCLQKSRAQKIPKKN